MRKVTLQPRHHHITKIKTKPKTESKKNCGFFWLIGTPNVGNKEVLQNWKIRKSYKTGRGWVIVSCFVNLNYKCSFLTTKRILSGTL